MSDGVEGYFGIGITTVADAGTGFCVPGFNDFFSPSDYGS